VLVGEFGNDSMFGGDGNDFMAGDGQFDGLGVPGGGNDFMSGGNGNDFMQGGFGTDTMNGDAGNDTMFGDTGNDTMNGGVGDDYIEGEQGNDTITGGEGDDHMSGGTGRDWFRFDSTDSSPGYGNDVIGAPGFLGSGRDFNLANRDTLVFDVDVGFDPTADITVLTGDWDGQGDALDVLVFTAAGSVLIEDFWEGASAPIQALAAAGAYDSAAAMNTYSQGNASYDMITFV
jgi:Ca2+-binding RTX toxin-like protein